MYKHSQLIFFHALGGPVIAYIDEYKRSVLIGTVHGAFEDCSNDLPGLFVEVDDVSTLEFLQREVFGLGK